MKLLRIDRQLAERQYAIHKGKPFYDGLIKYITSGPAVVAAVRGPRAVEVTRKLIGKTFGYEAEPGTIRGDFSTSQQMNLVHASDGPEAARREIEIFFMPDEIHAYQPTVQPWMRAPDEG